MAQRSKIGVPPHAPYNPPQLSSEIVYAVKAVFSGSANAHQQTEFCRWLIAEVCKKDDMSFRPGGAEGSRDTDFAEGKRFVAISLLKPLNMPPEMVAQMREQELAQHGPLTEGDHVGRNDE